MASMRWLAAAVIASGLAASAGCKTSMEYYKDGVHELEAKNYDAAISSFSGAIDKDPESDLSYVNRGDAYLGKKSYAEALKDYDRSVQLNEPSGAPNPWFYNRRGLAHYRLNQYDLALVDWKKAKDLEDRRAARGLKVRQSNQYAEMQKDREEFMPDAERKSASVPAEPTVAAVPTPAPGGTPEPTPAVAPTPAPEPTPDQKMEEELARLRAEEQRRQEAATKPPEPAPTPAPVVAEPPKPEPAPAPVAAEPPKPVVNEGEEAAVIEKARQAREAAAAERARREMAMATPPPPPPPAPEPPPPPPEPTPAPAPEPVMPPPAPAPEPAPVVAPVPVPVPAPESHEAPAPAARVEKPKRIAQLTGNWARDDGIVFNLTDDGFRVVGEAAGSELYVYYEVTLEWKDDHTLAGFGSLKENVDQCKFETSVAWTLDVTDATHSKSKIEEVAWNDQCQEVDRGPLEHTFEKKK